MKSATLIIELFYRKKKAFCENLPIIKKRVFKMGKEFGRNIRTKIADILYSLGYLGKLIVASLTFASRGKASRKILIMQLLFTYVEALPICCFLAAGIDSSVFMIANTFLTALGQNVLKYDLLVLLIMRELGPILIAFIVTARSATARPRRTWTSLSA